MINGLHVGGTANQCFLTFFKYDAPGATNWLFGNIVMQKYYMIYDMSMYEEKGYL